MSASPDSLKHGIKRLLKPLYLRGRYHAARLFRSYSARELEAALRELGLSSGASVMVHSAFSRSNGFEGSPADAIECFARVVGDEGNLLMVSMPYRGSSEAYAARGEAFEVAGTPSAMGIISETFRRQDGVRRSANPLHPVLARGPKARWLTVDHELMSHSCGKGSPFERLLRLDGRVLFYDVPFSTLTFMHYVEHHFRDVLPVRVYDADAIAMTLVDEAGDRRESKHYVFSRETRDRRNFPAVENALLARGLLPSRRIGNTRLMTVRVRDVFECARELIESGPGIYRNGDDG